MHPITTQLTWLGETLQGQVNILGFRLLRNQKVENLEVLAVDKQRASRRRGRQFLHTAHQTVKYLSEVKNKTKTDILRTASAAHLHTFTVFLQTHRLQYVFQTVTPYPCFIAHSGLALHEDGVCGSQVQGAHPAPSRGESVKQLDILHLDRQEEEEEEEEHQAASSSAHQQLLTCL